MTGITPERPRFQLTDEPHRLFDLVCEGKSDTFKAKLLEIMRLTGIEESDPLFILLAATGRLELLLDEVPQQFDEKLDRLTREFEAREQVLDTYSDGLEKKFRQTFIEAVKLELKDIEGKYQQKVELEIEELQAQQKRAIQKPKFPMAPILVAGSAAVLFLLVGGALGVKLGYQLATPNVTAAELVSQLDPTGPRQLTLEEAAALDWLESEEGRQVRQLWELNKGTVEVCRHHTRQLEGKCAIIIDPSRVPQKHQEVE